MTGLLSEACHYRSEVTSSTRVARCSPAVNALAPELPSLKSLLGMTRRGAAQMFFCFVLLR